MAPCSRPRRASRVQPRSNGPIFGGAGYLPKYPPGFGRAWSATSSQRVGRRHWSATIVAQGLAQTTFRPKPDVANSSGHSESYDGVKVKPSSIQPVTPPIIIFTGKPSRARRNAALLAPLQCGPAQ